MAAVKLEYSKSEMSDVADSPTKFDYDVFISYSSRDQDWVRGQLLRRIEQAGLKAFIDFRDFRPGAPSISECERGVIASRKTLVVLSPDYLASGWGEIENIMLQTIDPANRSLRLIPILRKPCNKPLRIGALTHVDFTDLSNAELSWEKLLTALRVQGASSPNRAINSPLRQHLSLQLQGERTLQEEVSGNFQIPNSVVYTAGEILGDWYYSHTKIDTLFGSNDFPGEPPEGNCVRKCQEWLRRANNCNDPLQLLSNVLAPFMNMSLENDPKWQAGFSRINQVLVKNHLSFDGNNVVPVKSPSTSLQLRVTNVDVIPRRHLVEHISQFTDYKGDPGVLRCNAYACDLEVLNPNSEAIVNFEMSMVSVDPPPTRSRCDGPSSLRLPTRFPIRLKRKGSDSIVLNPKARAIFELFDMPREGDAKLRIISSEEEFAYFEAKVLRWDGDRPVRSDYIMTISISGSNLPCSQLSFRVRTTHDAANIPCFDIQRNS